MRRLRLPAEHALLCGGRYAPARARLAWRRVRCGAPGPVGGESHSGQPTAERGGAAHGPIVVTAGARALSETVCLARGAAPADVANVGGLVVRGRPRAAGGGRARRPALGGPLDPGA